MFGRPSAPQSARRIVIDDTISSTLHRVYRKVPVPGIQYLDWRGIQKLV